MNEELTAEELELAREARNAYHREYSRKNRERIRENNKRFHKKNPDKAKEYNQRYWLKIAEGNKAE